LSIICVVVIVAPGLVTPVVDDNPGGSDGEGVTIFSTACDVITGTDMIVISPVAFPITVIVAFSTAVSNVATMVGINTPSSEGLLKTTTRSISVVADLRRLPVSLVSLNITVIDAIVIPLSDADNSNEAWNISKMFCDWIR